MSSKRDNVIDDNSVGLNEIDVLYSYAMVLSRNRTEAAGMVHETYLHAIKAKDSLRVGANIKSWLLAILRNIWINQFCDGRNPPDMTVVDQRTADVAVERVMNLHELCETTQERVQLRSAIQRLPLQFREVIVLRYYGGLSYREIAGILNCPVETIESCLGRARSILRFSVIERID
jgi:RNA polymerase sigma-70 factor (ECF subfamily)